MGSVCLAGYPTGHLTKSEQGPLKEKPRGRGGAHSFMQHVCLRARGGSACFLSGPAVLWFDPTLRADFSIFQSIKCLDLEGTPSLHTEGTSTSMDHHL